MTLSVVLIFVFSVPKSMVERGTRVRKLAAVYDLSRNRKKAVQPTVVKC